MKLLNDIGLIGDFLGTIPVMIELAKRSPEGLQVAGVHPEIKELFTMIPVKYKITEALSTEGFDEALDLSEAFRIASVRDLHMTQAHFAVLGLEVPSKPVRPELELDGVTSCIKTSDYIVSPFSRSLMNNPDQLWPRHYWQELVDIMADRKFILIGKTAHDDFNYLKGKNIQKAFNNSFNYLSLLMRNVRGVISVVTGTSHLSYALDVQNYLFRHNQGTWGLNPEAMQIDVDTDPEEMAEILIKAEAIKKSLTYESKSAV